MSATCGLLKATRFWLGFIALINISFLPFSQASNHLPISFDRSTGSYALSIKINVPRAMPNSLSATPTADYDLLPRLKSILSEASRLLYGATRQHAHIGQVTFFLPDDWPHDLDEFTDKVECVRCTNELECDSLSKIHIVAKSQGQSEQATVHDMRKCGEEAGGPMEIPSLLIYNYTLQVRDSTSEEEEL